MNDSDNNNHNSDENNSSPNEINVQKNNDFSNLLDDESFLNDLESIDIDADELLLQGMNLKYIIRNRYLYVYLYNKSCEFDQLPGKFVNSVTTTVGFTLHIFEHCIVLTPGGLSLEEYGNWGRAISSIQEMLEKSEVFATWSELGIWACDSLVEADVWAEARLRNLPVSEEAPSTEAEYKYQLLNKVYGSKAHKLHKKPGGAPRPL